jgi:hypothetical protein
VKEPESIPPILEESRKRAADLLTAASELDVGSGYIDIYGIAAASSGPLGLRVGGGVSAQAKLSEGWSAIGDVRAYYDGYLQAEALAGLRYKW